MSLATGVSAGPLPGADADLDRLCLSTTVGSLDATAAAADEVPNDIIAARGKLSEGTGSAFYGSEKKFKGLVFDVGVAGIGGDLAWFYYNGLGWEPLTFGKDQGPARFHETGLVSMEFKRAEDWTPRTVHGECGKSMYYIMSANGWAYDVVPLLNQVSVIT